MESHADGVVGSVNTKSSSSSVRNHVSFSIPPTSSTMNLSTQSHPTPTQSFKVNAVQSSSSQPSGGKKDKKGKKVRGGNVSIDVEVVYEPLDCNIFLGWSWFYAMTVVASSIFLTLQFSHQGKIVTIDQLDYCTLDICNYDTNNVPFLIDSKYLNESVRVGLLTHGKFFLIFP